MSRILTELECRHCKTTTPIHISFGHPENTFHHKWTCGVCGKENLIEVKEWIPSTGSQNEVEVYKSDPTSTVRVFSFGWSDLATTYPLSTFQWKDFRDPRQTEELGGWLRLKDISDQLKERTEPCIGVIYVWVESPLYGAIYQYGNYCDDEWLLHAKTKGYA